MPGSQGFQLPATEPGAEPWLQSVLQGPFPANVRWVLGCPAFCWRLNRAVPIALSTGRACHICCRWWRTRSLKLESVDHSVVLWQETLGKLLVLPCPEVLHTMFLSKRNQGLRGEKITLIWQTTQSLSPSSVLITRVNHSTALLGCSNRAEKTCYRAGEPRSCKSLLWSNSCICPNLLN